MTTQEVVIANQLSDLKPTEFMMGEPQTKSWNFTDKTGKQLNGSNNWVEIYYKTPGHKLNFIVENVKTSGVKTDTDMRRGFMSITLSPEQSAQIRKAVDDPIFMLAWQNREKLYKMGRKMTQPIEMKFAYRGVVKDGAERKDANGVVQRGGDGKVQVWADSITCNIPMKRQGNQVVVDAHQCQVVDLQERNYAWTGLEGKQLREVVIEVEKVVFNDKVTVHCNFKLIVPNEVGNGGVRYSTKRRMEAEVPSDPEAPKADAAPSAPAVAAAPPAPGASVAAAMPTEKKQPRTA